MKTPVRYVIRPETGLGPGPYSVYADGQYLTTVDTMVEARKVRAEHRAESAAGDATSSAVTTSPA